MLDCDRGLIQKRKNGVYFVRKIVPIRLRNQVGGKFEGRREVVKSLGTNDLRTARRLAPAVRSELDAEFDHHHALGAGEALTLTDVVGGIEKWQKDHVDAAIASGLVKGERFVFREVTLPKKHRATILEAIQSQYEGDYVLPTEAAARPATIGPDIAEVAKSYFRDHPNASRELGTPHVAGLLIGRLQVASREPEGWRDILAFETTMNAELADYLTIPLPPSLQLQARQRFADAWLTVEQTRVRIPMMPPCHSEIMPPSVPR